MAARHTPLIDDWVAAFLADDEAARFGRATARHAGAILQAFLRAACGRADAMPADLDDDDVRHGLFAGTLPMTSLPATVRRTVPSLCAALLRHAAAAGRMASRDAARRTRLLDALAPAYRTDAGVPDVSTAARASGGAPPVKGASRPPRADGHTRPNEVCPCGSGRKFKRCCGR